MKRTRAYFTVLLCLFALFGQTSAQEQFDYEAERKKAIQLVGEYKYTEALPILEKLAAAKADDAVVLQYLSMAVLVNATISKKPPEELKKDLIRARSLAIKSRDLGNNSSLIEMILEQVPSDGNPEAFTGSKKRTPAAEALLEGEGAFVKGDTTRAIEHYERAAKLDPKLYEAPLFIGDVYYKTKQIDKAGEWYARAIAIDPDRETAYRYWGNVLMSDDRMEESREKLIEAVIADPYNRNTWQFLDTWARRNQKRLGHLRIEVPTSSVKRKDEKNIDILVNPVDKKDGTEAWMLYSISRAAWMTAKQFSEAFPDEKEYRHSLREEAEALRLTAESVAGQIKEGKLKESALDVSIANLLKLYKAEMIEPYVLLAIPDAGIARDYIQYRKINRDKLRRYVSEFVILNN
jgi:tetratricopeptide (TPR) repeat protein